MKQLLQNRVYHLSILLLLLLVSAQSAAQVTIGSSEAPAKGAILDLKEKKYEGNVLTNSSKGLGLPRVSLRSKTDLYPMFDATPEAANPSANPNYNTPEKKSEQDAMHVGLLVYNIGPENIVSVETQLCKGLHIWNSTKWVPLIAYPSMSSIFDVVRCKPGGTFTVSNVVLNGVYKKGVALGSSHYIDVTINAASDAIGTEYILKTYSPNNDGVGFSGTGTITSAQQVIRLYAEGAITSYGDKNLILTSNSSSIPQTQYPITIEVLLPVLRIVGVGTTAYNPISSYTGSKGYKLMTNTNAFGSGENALVQIEGISFEHYTSRTTVQWRSLLQSMPDIIVRTYNTIVSNELSADIKAYLDAGGVFLDYNDAVNSSSAALKGIYGVSAEANIAAGAAGTLMLIENVNDEIIKGPFGDMAGKFWSEDASTARGISGIDENSIIIYSRSPVTGNPITSFRDKKLNYFYQGDGGSLVGEGLASACCYPFQLDANNMPTTGWQGKPNNAAYFGNVMAWAMKQAAKKY